MSVSDETIMREMEYALSELQRVRTGDYRGAYYAAVGGTLTLRPHRSEVAAEMMSGRLLALDLIVSQWA